MIPHEKLIALYTSMVKCRLAAEAAGVQASGEAVYAAVAADLTRTDSLCAAQNHALLGLARGASFAKTLTALHSAHRARKGAAEALAEAVDAARRHKTAKKKRVAIALAGDTEAKPSAWKKALAAAAKRSLPAIFVSLRASGEAPAFLDTETIPAEAIAFGVPLITVDGNDAVAVYRVVYESLARARELNNPTLIDCLYTGSDSLSVMESWLRARNLLTPYKKRAITMALRAELAQASSSPVSASKK